MKIANTPLEAFLDFSGKLAKFGQLVTCTMVEVFNLTLQVSDLQAKRTLV